MLCQDCEESFTQQTDPPESLARLNLSALFDYPADRRIVAVGLKRRPPTSNKGIVKDATERVDVGGVTGVLKVLNLLRRKIQLCPPKSRRGSESRSTTKNWLHKAKIREPPMAVMQKYVRRLKIAMHVPEQMELLQSIKDI